MLLAVTITCSFTLGLLVISCTAAQFTTKPLHEESLQCTGSGMLMFQGDGRFSIVRESGKGKGSLICTGGEISVMANSALYTRIISKGTFVCKSSSSVRICGYGNTELIHAETVGSGRHSLLQCNGELLLPMTRSSTNTFCIGNGNFSVQGFGNFTIKAHTITCTADANMIIQPMLHKVTGTFFCAGIGPYTISGYGEPFSMTSEFGNCTYGSLLPTIKYCTGSGEYSLVGEGNYNISTLSGNISCFGDATSYGLYFTTFGPFCCQGEDRFILDGSGFLYLAFATDYDNCSSLIDSTSPISYNSNIITSCVGTGAHAFVGNGYFNIIVDGTSSNDGLKCDGSVSDIYISNNGTLYVSSYGQFRCISSGDLLINGTGVVEDDNIYCTVSPIAITGELLECSGTGEFKIIGSGFFDIRAISEITCTGNGEFSQFDIGERFMSRGSFACNGSVFFTLNGTGEIESVTTVLGSHNCTDIIMPIASGSGVIEVVTCFGEGDYVVVGDGNFYINRTGPGMLRCSGEVISGVNASQKAEYFTNGEFICTISGIVYLTGIGRAEVINASASYECNGVFFPGPTVEPPFSGFGGDEITCFAYGEIVIVGYGQIHIIAQSPTPLDCQGAVSSDLDHNVVESSGDFMCTGNGFVQITGRGEVFVNSTGYNNCTRRDNMINDSTSPVSYDLNILTSCVGTGAHAFVGNGHFHLTIYGTSSNDGLKCDGSVSNIYTYNGTLYTFSYGQFRCISSGDLLMYGMGVIEDDNLDCNITNIISTSTFTPAPTTLFPTSIPTPSASLVYSCYGVGSNFTIQGTGYFRLSFTDNDVYCVGDIFSLAPDTYQTFSQFYCYGSANFTIELTRRDIGASLNISADFHNCDLDIAFMKFCSGSGEYSLVGEGNYNISILSGNISCFGDVTSYGLYSTTFGPFCCQGEDRFILDGSGFLYLALATDYDNCSSLIDSTSPISYNSNILTSCIGTGAHAFVGNGYFNIIVDGTSSNDGLKCDGSVSDIYISNNGTLYVSSYGQFRCISSGNLLINGTGVVEDNNIYCTVSPIAITGELLECSGTGEFKIIGSGFFDIRAISEITCTGNGEFSQFDIGERFMSRGSFVCNGSVFFTLNGTGEIESVTTVLGSHNCTDIIMPIASGSDVIEVVTCFGEGDYVVVGDGNFYINRTGPGMLRCSGEVISGVNTSQKAEYFTNGKFICTISGIVYLTGIGRAEVINASASYECNGVFFPGPTVEPPFSGFGGDEITCFAYGEIVLVGYGQIHIVAQSPTPLDCQGAVSSDLDHNVVESSGDFMCTGNGFVQITGRGEVFVNSTGYNNCTRHDNMINDSPLLCSGFGEYEIFGSANGTILSSDELMCNGAVFPLTSSNRSPYYIGGYYRCISIGLFSISGVGNAKIVSTINDTAGQINYNCIGSQSLTCAIFAFGGNVDENVTLIGEGEFTIIGDEQLHCAGNVVLCPGEINYYFTDGYFYCSSDVFAHINGTGTIKNITGVNNCSGFGFGVPPIISGTLLTPQPSCIGFSDQYQISGNGTFNTSRLIGSLNCIARIQEPNSDVHTFSSNEELFNCNGSGIFLLGGTGDSVIILDNGYFNCVDLTSLTIGEQLYCFSTVPFI